MRRVLRGAVGVLIWPALAAVPHAARHSQIAFDPFAFSAPIPSSLSRESADASPAFRLGDASRPFRSEATGVGDFNTDGQADVAVLDRIARRPGLSSYRLELSVSGLAPDDVAFESEEEALSVSVSDVDRDNDLDVVVSGVPSGQTVGVWLNDGHGRFTQADVTPSPGAKSASTSCLTEPALDPSPGWLQTETHVVPLPLTRATPDTRRARLVIHHQAGRRRSTDASNLVGPRAPPAI